MAWDANRITLGEVVGGSWLAGKAKTPREYLSMNRVGFLYDIVAITGWSEEQVREDLARLGDEDGYLLDVAAHEWPAADAVTILYHSPANPDTNKMLARWAQRALDACHGLPEANVPIVMPAAAYAAHIGHLGRAIAGLIAARDAGLITEVRLPDRWNAGISPAYMLPAHTYLWDGS